MIDILIKELVSDICKKYKISGIEAEKIIHEEVKKYNKIISKWGKEKDPKKIYRTSAYKDFVKKIKKKIYYSLRTYQKEGATPQLSHISTKERAEYLKEFLFQINDVLKLVDVVFDVGGGMFLTSFPFDDYKNIKKYIWLYKGHSSYKKILHFVV